MYLLVIKQRTPKGNGRGDKTEWGAWKHYWQEIHPTKKALMTTLADRRHYLGDTYEQFDVKYYPIDEKTVVTVKMSVVIEEVK